MTGSPTNQAFRPTTLLTLLLSIGLLAAGVIGIPQTAKASTAPGSLDSTFVTGSGFNDRVRTIVVQPDGSILVGGDFNRYDGRTVGGLAKLDSAGNLDSAFNSEVGVGFNDNVQTIALQSDGKILVGGDFSKFKNVDVPQIARLNPDGTLDTNFDPSGSSVGPPRVHSIVVQPTDQKIVVGGDFTGGPIAGIARLNTDGSPDPDFHALTGTDNVVRAVALQSDGKIVIAGDFTGYAGTSGLGKIARLDTDGNLDGTFNETCSSNCGFNEPVFSLGVQSDNKILVGSEATTYNGNSIAKGIARLDKDGAIDTEFNSNAGTGAGGSNILIAVRSFAVQSDGKILVGGRFDDFDGNTSRDAVRLTSSGDVDTTFSIGSGFGPDVNPPPAVFAVTLQPDGKILVGGNFTEFNGQTSNGIARLNGTPTSTPTPTPTPTPTKTLTPTPSSPTVTPAPIITPTPDMQPPAAPRIVKKALTKLKRQLAKGKAGAKSLRLKLRLSGDADARASALQWRFKVKASKSQRAKKTWSGWTSVAVSPNANTAKVQVGKDRKVRKSLTGPARDNATVNLQVRSANDAGLSKAKSVRLRPRAAVPVLPANG